MKKQILGGMIAATLMVPALAGAADYVIDATGAHASVNFKIKHLGYSWLIGRFNQFEGGFSPVDDEKMIFTNLAEKGGIGGALTNAGGKFARPGTDLFDGAVEGGGVAFDGGQFTAGVLEARVKNDFLRQSVGER